MKTERNLKIISILVFCVIIAFSGIFLLSLNEKRSTPQFSMSVNDSDNKKVTEYDENGTKENFGIGLYNAPFHDANYSMHYSKSLQPDDSLEGYLFMSNQMNVKNEFLVFCLLDYNQVPFSHETGSTQVLQVIPLEAHEERFFYFNIGNVSEGVHDFEIFMIMKPNEHSLDENFRRSTDFSLLGSRRINVFVNDTRFRDPVYTDFSPQNYSPSCGPQYPVNNGIMITKEPCSTMVWFVENITARNRTLGYNINAAADNKYPVSFGLIALLDYQQIPVQDASGNKVIFGKLAQGQKISIPASVIIPSEKGIHELMVIWLPAPYHKLEDKPGKISNIPEGIWSTPSVRVALNIP